MDNSCTWSNVVRGGTCGQLHGIIGAGTRKLKVKMLRLIMACFPYIDDHSEGPAHAGLVGHAFVLGDG